VLHNGGCCLSVDQVAICQSVLQTAQPQASALHRYLL
jgi:hypothetical protein